LAKDSATQIFLDALNLSHKNNDNYLGWCSGYFANVVELSKDVSIAFSMDGIGLKIKLYQLAGKYDQIGYDCIAACVNDLICVGAEPVAIMDYLHMSNANEQIIHEIGLGFKNAAMDARLNILGGETSVYGDSKKQVLDVCGVAVGRLKFRTPIMGHDIRQGNVIVGLHSTGLHCNGTTEAIQNYNKEDLFSVHTLLKQSMLEALTVPTACYSRVVTELFKVGIKPTGLVNISGGGITNMLRLQSQGVAFEFTHFPEVPDLFKVIRMKSEMPIGDMFNIYNMGIGFYMIIQQDEINQAVKILDLFQTPYSIMGRVVANDQKKISWRMNHEHM